MVSRSDVRSWPRDACLTICLCDGGADVHVLLSFARADDNRLEVVVSRMATLLSPP